MLFEIDAFRIPGVFILWIKPYGLIIGIDGLIVPAQIIFKLAYLMFLKRFLLIIKI